ncbi:MAG: hypothetical protein M3P98_00645 [bacterium]|nr:hypothetical protein [bacterium]
MRAKQLAFISFMVFLLLLIGLLIFTIDWGGSEAKEEVVVKQLVLHELSETPATVTFLKSGPIVADSKHRELLITVNNAEIVAQIIQGYEGTVIKTSRFANNAAAYQAFLAALEDIYFNNSRIYTGARTSEGSCPTGRRYTYTLKNAYEFDFETWGNSCNKDTGTFAGSNSQVEQLFKAQVPNIQDLTKSQQL